jgi:hypothetical protein
MALYREQPFERIVNVGWNVGTVFECFFTAFGSNVEAEAIIVEVHSKQLASLVEIEDEAFRMVDSVPFNEVLSEIEPIYFNARLLMKNFNPLDVFSDEPIFPDYYDFDIRGGTAQVGSSVGPPLFLDILINTRKGKMADEDFRQSEEPDKLGPVLFSHSTRITVTKGAIPNQVVALPGSAVTWRVFRNNFEIDELQG